MTDYQHGFVKSAAAPTSPQARDLWWDETADVMRRWTGTAWSPAQISIPASISGLAYWYDATQETVVADGTAMAQATDFSGNTKHAPQATAGFRPLYKTSIQNGKPVFRFDGTDDVLEIPSVSTRTVFAVAYWRGAGSGFTVFAANYGIVGETSDGDHSIRTNSGAAQCALRTPAGGSIWVDGVSTPNFSYGTAHVASAVLGTNNVQALHMGQGVGAGTFWNGDIAEIIGYSTALSTTDRQTIEAYLKSKWGTP